MSTYKKALREFETVLFTKVLHRSKGFETKAATRLGIARGTLRTKCREYGIDVHAIRGEYRKHAK